MEQSKAESLEVNLMLTLDKFSTFHSVVGSLFEFLSATVGRSRSYFLFILHQISSLFNRFRATTKFLLIKTINKKPG